MIGRSPDDLARACAEAMYARDAHAKHLGIAIDEVRTGYARLSMTIAPEHVNGHAIVHGGVVFTLADTAFAYACNSRDLPNVALQCSISFVAPGREGERIAVVCEERSGGSGRTGVYDATVTTDDGAPIAFFRGVSYRVRGSVLEGPGEPG